MVTLEEKMPLTKSVVKEMALRGRWKDIFCTECGHKFVAGDVIYVHWSTGRIGNTRGRKKHAKRVKTFKNIKAHLCEKCGDKKYVDVKK